MTAWTHASHRQEREGKDCPIPGSVESKTVEKDGIIISCGNAKFSVFYS